MKGKARLNGIVRVLKGVMAAAVVTLVGILILSFAVMLRGIGENTIQILNQAIKVISILSGVWISVGRGGEKGLVSGAVVGILYILIGYGLYSVIDGTQASASVMAIEETAGALIGGLAGVVLANMKPARK